MVLVMRKEPRLAPPGWFRPSGHGARLHTEGRSDGWEGENPYADGADTAGAQRDTIVFP